MDSNNPNRSMPNRRGRKRTYLNGHTDPNANKKTVKAADSTEDTKENNQSQSPGNDKNQLVVYDPAAVTAGPIVPRSRSPSKQTSRGPATMAEFTVQCAKCYKWRVIPKEEKYEEIRAHILKRLFYCVNAREWRSEISCDDPSDISQDDCRTWAIDIPGIMQPPSGWKRHVRIRAEGGTKFADVYYVAPSGKKFRSLVEVEKFLQEHPGNGVQISQFSFQIPKPLNENYVKKRNNRSAPRDRGVAALPGSHEPVEVNPISWIGPDGKRKLNIEAEGKSDPDSNADVAPTEPKKRRTES